MPGDGPELSQPVGELALVAVLAGAVLLVRPAQLRLVAAGVDRHLDAGDAGTLAGGSGRRRGGRDRLGRVQVVEGTARAGQEAVEAGDGGGGGLRGRVAPGGAPAAAPATGAACKRLFGN